MQGVVSAAVLADLIDEIHASDKNPLGITHKRNYTLRRNDYGTYVPSLPRVSLD